MYKMIKDALQFLNSFVFSVLRGFRWDKNKVLTVTESSLELLGHVGSHFAYCLADNFQKGKLIEIRDRR